MPVNLQEIPKEVRTLMKNNQKRKEEKSKEDIDLSALPPGLSENLLPFQWKGIEFALEHDGKARKVDINFCFRGVHYRRYVGGTVMTQQLV